MSIRIIDCRPPKVAQLSVVAAAAINFKQVFMTNREIALGFVRNFCKGDISGLEKLLAPDLSFKGPFHAFSLASEYIASLKSDQPEKCQCNILSGTEDMDSVALFYEHSKPTGVQHIAQLFKISGQQIKEILLVFDGR